MQKAFEDLRRFELRYPRVRERPTSEYITLVREANEAFHRDSRVKRFMYFVTLNPRPDVPLEKLCSVVEKISRRKFIEKIYYTFEQRGEDIDSLGSGIHSHMLFFSTNSFGQVKRDLQNTCKSIVGNPMHVDVRLYTSEMYEDKLDYLRGVKWDPDKESKIEMDKLFRIKNNLESIYIINATHVSQGVPPV